MTVSGRHLPGTLEGKGVIQIMAEIRLQVQILYLQQGWMYHQQTIEAAWEGSGLLGHNLFQLIYAVLADEYVYS